MREPTIKERLSVLETEISYIKKMLYGVVALLASQLGFSYIPKFLGLTPII